MKRICIYLALTVMLTVTNGCDKDFEEINTNPVGATVLDPVYLFANAQYSTAMNTINYQHALVQQIVSPFTGVLEGGNHNVVYDPNARVVFNGMYTAGSGPIVLLTDIIAKTKDNEARSNLYNMARIMKAFDFQILVDTYGDVPYSEAGKGYLEGISLPKYDTDETIYADLLKEVSEATAALDASKAIETGDIFYKGKIEQWKRLGNSILLRIAMRYSKVAPATAQQYAAAAYAGGVMNSVEDNVIIKFNGTFNHPCAGIYQGTERGNYYLAKPFVDYLKNTNDPRLGVISVKYEYPAQPLATVGVIDDTLSHQIGMPLGYSEVTIATAPDFPGVSGASWKYSQPNRTTVAKIDSPEFFITYAQTMLLCAEAAQRGWISGDVETFYNAGVKAHMDQMAQYDVTATISAADQDAYLDANPFNEADALEQINTQYWIASFQNGPEAWANFRRTGYPVLSANTYPTADASTKTPAAGGFVHRLVYPVRENSVNTVNYNAAVTSIGGADDLGTRIFWDIQ